MCNCDENGDPHPCRCTPPASTTEHILMACAIALIGAAVAGLTIIAFSIFGGE